MVIPGAITYIFDGISFYRRVEDEFMTIPHPQLTYDVSPILDGPVYVDFGGITAKPFEMVGAFETRAERLAMIEKIGTVGTLEKTGYTLQAALVAAAALGLGDTGWWFAALTFQVLDAWPWAPS